MEKMIFLVLLSFFLHRASSIPVDEPVSFSFSSFNPKSCSDGSLICLGAVTALSDHLSLTSEPSPKLPLQKIGRALYSKPVSVWPAMIYTSFTFRISPYKTTSPADGMTFIFAPDNKPAPSDAMGGSLGLASLGTNSTLLAVEMDTYDNSEWFDPNDNHIGIDIGSSRSDPAKSLDSLGIKLTGGRPIQVQIYYDGWTNILYVSVGYAGTPLKKFIERPLLISEILPSSVYVGFTGSTGPTLAESHQVLNWTFTTFPLPSSSLITKQNR